MEKRRMGIFATDLPMASIAGECSVDAGSLTSPLTMSQYVLSHWHWVSENMIESLSLGNFDIENLPKLHRSDELRNAYLKRSMTGIYQPLDGGPAEIVVGTSKLHSSFRDPTMFLSCLANLRFHSSGILNERWEHVSPIGRKDSNNID